MYNTLETHTRYAHIVRGRPTLKDVERFRNESVREPYERCLHERTLMTEPFIEKHAISTELSNVNREKHRRKSHRVRRRDREPSRILIRSLKRLTEKSRAHILLCIPRSSSLPRSRFLDVTQRSPKTTAADIRTTFLSHCPCGLFAVHWTDQSHTWKSEWRKVSRENVDVAFLYLCTVNFNVWYFTWYSIRLTNGDTTTTTIWPLFIGNVVKH